MKDRKERLDTIKKLLLEQKINSQEQLQNQLADQGFDITQATLSRDLKSLKVNKVFDDVLGYYYTLPSDENLEETYLHYVKDIQRGFLSMDFSGNLCVINTLSGHANPVAAALDRLELDDVLGTIAGDDTILIILKERVTAEHFTEMFDRIIHM